MTLYMSFKQCSHLTSTHILLCIHVHMYNAILHCMLLYLYYLAMSYNAFKMSKYSLCYVILCYVYVISDNQNKHWGTHNVCHVLLNMPILSITVLT